MKQVIGACFLVAVLVLWEGLAQFNPDSVLIAGPLAIGRYLSENTGLMTRAVLASGKNAAWGFLWGNVAAIVLAAFVILFPRSERTTSALALFVFCLPLVATGPILRVLFGPGDGPQISLAALAVYYTTYLALIVGLRAIPQSWSDLMTIYGRGSVTTLLVVRLRACIPYLFVGLQIAAPAALLGAMIGEFTGAERGLGVLTLRAMRGLDVDATWALATVAASVAIAAYACVGWIGERLVGYRPVVLLTPPREGGRRSGLWRVAAFCLTVCLVVLVWQVAMDAFDLNRFFAKRPGDVWAYLTTGPENRTILLEALGETMAMAIPGYVVGMFLGAGLAALLVLAPGIASAVMPVAVALRSVPIITTAPILVLALGRGTVGTVTVVAVMIFFPTLVACLQGLRQTPGQIVDVFQSYGAGRFRLLITAQIPSMLPAFFAAARMAVPAALLAVTTTEWLATGKGIGVLMALTATTSNYNMLWSCVVVLALAAVALYALVAWIERQVLRTYAAEQVT